MRASRHGIDNNVSGPCKFVGKGPEITDSAVVFNMTTHDFIAVVQEAKLIMRLACDQVFLLDPRSCRRTITFLEFQCIQHKLTT